jgi:hypothetical protein
VTGETRINEWFVPRFGPPKFRAFVGLLFLPYTGMCISFTIIGAMLAPDVHWERAGAIALIYALALGVGAHAADTIGSKKAKPWGSYFTRRQMLALMAASLAGAYAVGIYYIVLYAPALAVIAALEGFFLFAYNFEFWGGRFHNNFWFAVSWGALPVAAGYVIQTNSFDLLPAAAATAAAVASYAEIRLSRPYKELKKSGDDSAARKLENKLKVLSVSAIAFSLAFVAARLAMP